jgi:hypothetical protein
MLLNEQKSIIKIQFNNNSMQFCHNNKYFWLSFCGFYVPGILESYVKKQISEEIKLLTLTTPSRVIKK